MSWTQKWRKYLISSWQTLPAPGGRCVSARHGKEVLYMKYFKITRTWSVKAEDEAEALRQIAADPTKHLESETVARTEYKRRKQETGWAAGIRSQLTGSNS